MHNKRMTKQTAATVKKKRRKLWENVVKKKMIHFFKALELVRHLPSALEICFRTANKLFDKLNKK